MSNYDKDIAQLKENLFLLVVVSLLFLLPLCIFHRCTDKDKIIPSQSIAPQTHFAQDVKRWKDQLDHSHSTILRQQYQQFKSNRQIDSLSHILKIKTKQVQQLSQIQAQISIREVLTTVHDTVWKDSIHYIVDTKFSFNNQWIDINGIVGSVDSINIKGIDTLVQTNYWKRKWFLGQKRYYSDFTNKNPYINILNASSIEIVKKHKKWTIGPYLGVGYQINTYSISSGLQVGIGVMYNAIEF